MSVIVLIEKRLFLRNCLHDCFDRSYPDHDIVGFGTLAECCNSIEEKTLNPAVIIYFASAAISPILKSELGRIEALSPNTPIIVVSDATSSDEINRVVGYGARGYIPTSMPYSLAVEAVRFVEAGGIFVPAAGNLPASSGSHDLRATAKTLTEQHKTLTEQQMKVVEAVGHRFANKQIAHRLKMSENTVKVHLRHIMKKLNVRNRTQIAIWTRNTARAGPSTPGRLPGND